jgi:hypothetical protein
LAEPAPSSARRLDQQVGLGPLLPFVEVFLGVDGRDLGVELRGLHVDQVLPFGDPLIEPRLDLRLLGEGAVGEHRLVLDLLLLRQGLKGLRVVVLPDEDVRQRQPVGLQPRGQGAAQCLYLAQTRLVVELLGQQIAQVLLHQRIREADHHRLLVRLAETELRGELVRIGDPVEDRHVHVHRIAVDRRHLDGRDLPVARSGFRGVVGELDHLDVPWKGVDLLVTADLPPVAGQDRFLPQAFGRTEGDLPDPDLAGRYVGHHAPAQEKQRHEQEEEQESDLAEPPAHLLQERRLDLEPWACHFFEHGCFTGLGLGPSPITTEGRFRSCEQLNATM